MRPLLSLLADGQVWRVRNITSTLADQFGLIEEERAFLLPGGRQCTFSKSSPPTTNSGRGPENGRPVIQGFVGALMGAQGDRGVFITTSSFTSGARLEVERVNARIELIDGRRLAELMVAYGVGVQAEATATLYETDEDFFESL